MSFLLAICALQSANASLLLPNLLSYITPTWETKTRLPPQFVANATLVGAFDSQPCLQRNLSLYCTQTNGSLPKLGSAPLTASCMVDGCYAVDCSKVEKSCDLLQLTYSGSSVLWEGMTKDPTTTLVALYGVIIAIDMASQSLYIYAHSQKQTLSIPNITQSSSLYSAVIGLGQVVLVLQTGNSWTVAVYNGRFDVHYTLAFVKQLPVLFQHAPFLSLDLTTLHVMTLQALYSSDLGNLASGEALQLTRELGFTANQQDQLIQATLLDSRFLFLQYYSNRSCLEMIYKAQPQSQTASWGHADTLCLDSTITQLADDGGTMLYVLTARSTYSIDVLALYTSLSSTNPAPITTAFGTTATPPAPNSRPGIVLIVVGAVVAVLVLVSSLIVYRKQWTQGLAMANLYAAVEDNDDHPKLLPDVNSKEAVAQDLPTTWYSVYVAIVGGGAEASINKQLQPHPSLANVLDEDDRSLLTYACLYMDRDTRSQQDTTGRAPIHWACALNSLESIEVMLDGYQPSIDLLCSSTANGRTVLHLAVAENHVELLGKLLQCDAGALRCCILETDLEQGETALALAERLGHAECQVILAMKLRGLWKPGESIQQMKRRLKALFYNRH